MTENRKEMVTVDDKTEMRVQKWVYLIDYYRAEMNIANKLKSLQDSDNLKHILNLEKMLKNTTDIELSEKQFEALKIINENNVTIITGGPGTGKTTIIKTIIEMYKGLGKKTVLCAPTGRAAKRMTEATGEEAKTLHRLLEIGKIVDDRPNANIDVEPIDADIVIIDEMSMVDLFLMNYLLNGIFKGTKLILVGDSDQLQSVGPGRVLKDLIDSDMINVTFLNELYRQDENSYIATLASEIKKNDLSEDFLTKKEDYSFIEANASNLKKYIEKVCLMAIELLAPMYKGENGIDNLNKLLQSIFNPDRGQNSIVSKDVIYRENDKILQLENDPDNNVFNGDIGYIMDITGSTITVDFDGNIVKYTPKDFIKIKHGYAISIHKAQGSEFKLVILPIIFSYRIMLYKKIIYTAVTRARNNLTIIGDPSSFVYAVNNENVYERKTKLKDRLLSYLMNI